MKLGGQIITREEGIRLPKYEEIKNQKELISFWNYEDNYIYLEVVYGKLELYIDYGDDKISLYKSFGEMSEENYEKALEEVKELYQRGTLWDYKTY